MKRLSDILLFPESLYRKVTDKKIMLYIGFIFVGIVDLAYPYLSDNFNQLFVGRPINIQVYNIVLSCLLVILVGIIHVAFFSLPLFDLFKIFKKEEQPSGKVATRTRLMKVYIMSFLLITPVDLLLYFTVFRYINIGSSTAVLTGYVGYFYLILVWASAIVSRGINTIYSFEPLYKRMVFAVVLLWDFLLGLALSFLLNNWIVLLFK